MNPFLPLFISIVLVMFLFIGVLGGLTLSVFFLSDTVRTPILSWSHPNSLLLVPYHTVAPSIAVDCSSLPLHYFPLSIHFLSSAVNINQSIWSLTSSPSFGMEVRNGIANRYSYFGRTLSQGSIFGAQLYINGGVGTSMQAFFMNYQQMVDFVYSNLQFPNQFLHSFVLQANQLYLQSFTVTNPISDIYFLLVIFNDVTSQLQYQSNGTNIMFHFTHSIHEFPQANQILSSCTLFSPGICQSIVTANPAYILIQSMLPPALNLTYTVTKNIYIVNQFSVYWWIVSFLVLIVMISAGLLVIIGSSSTIVMFCMTWKSKRLIIQPATETISNQRHLQSVIPIQNNLESSQQVEIHHKTDQEIINSFTEVELNEYDYKPQG